MPHDGVTYDRRLLVMTLAHHRKVYIPGCKCSCGWSEIGRSHAEHIADVYESALAELTR